MLMRSEEFESLDFLELLDFLYRFIFFFHAFDGYKFVSLDGLRHEDLRKRALPLLRL